MRMSDLHCITIIHVPNNYVVLFFISDHSSVSHLLATAATIPWADRVLHRMKSVKQN